MSTPMPLLEVQDLKTYFYTRRGVTKAVDGVSFSLQCGQTLALVGESGCGKTTLAKLFLLLEKPTAGSLLFYRKDITTLTGSDLACLSMGSEKWLFRRFGEVEAGFWGPRPS